MSANLVLHWHLDALTPQSRALDSSDNHLNGTVAGDPQNRPDDRFGSVLHFNGTSDALSVPDTPLLRLATYTVEVWVNPASPLSPGAGVAGKPPNDFRLVLNADGSVAHHFSTSANPDENHSTGPGSVTAGAWRHIAIVNDGHTATIYLDGKAASAHPFTGDRTVAQVPLQVGTGGWYGGLLAHLRIYDGPLTDLEIQRDMADDEAALAAFVRSHPLDFALLDVDQQPVLFIDDDPAGQPMKLRLTNTSRQDIEPLPLMSGPASPTNYHLALHFRTGVLAVPPQPTVLTPGWSLQLATDPATGDTVLYLASVDPPAIGRGATYDLALQGLSADGTGGTRGTRVELTYQNMRYSGEQDELTGQRIQFLEIVNRRGRKDIPLAVGFVGGNRVLSDGVTSNTLRFRIANVSRDTALSLKGASFTLSYDIQEANESHEWALSDAGQAGRAALGGLVADKVAPAWTITNENLGQRMEWTLKPAAETAFGPDGSIVVTLSQVFALSSLGQAQIIIGYQNIPGYQDGSVTLVAEKSPLMFLGQNAGVGTTTPEAKLQVINANTDPNGSTLILGPTAQSNLRLGYHQDYSWIQSHGSKPLAINAIGNNVGVGTATPEAKLQVVNTDTDPNGSTLILGPTAQSNLRLGYHQDYSWIQSHGSKPLAINAIGNNVGIGTANPQAAKVAVSADSSHLQLRREPGAAGGNQLYLELFQDNSPNPVHPFIRFHHSNVFWHRIEGRPEGLMFKDGNPGNDNLIDIYANTAVVNALRVGGITISAYELQILQKLAAGTLQFDLWNVIQNEYAYAADYSPFDNDRRHVFTWRRKGERVNQGRWQISFPS